MQSCWSNSGMDSDFRWIRGWIRIYISYFWVYSRVFSCVCKGVPLRMETTPLWKLARYRNSKNRLYRVRHLHFKIKGRKWNIFFGGEGELCWSLSAFFVAGCKLDWKIRRRTDTLLLVTNEYNCFGSDSSVMLWSKLFGIQVDCRLHTQFCFHIWSNGCTVYNWLEYVFIFRQKERKMFVILLMIFTK